MVKEISATQFNLLASSSQARTWPTGVTQHFCSQNEKYCDTPPISPARLTDQHIFWLLKQSIALTFSPIQGVLTYKNKIQTFTEKSLEYLSDITSQ